jgi:hypothetical protein
MFDKGIAPTFDLVHEMVNYHEYPEEEFRKVHLNKSRYRFVHVGKIINNITR